MDELIIRVLNGKASAFETERLSRWKNESSENDAYFREVARVWALTAPEPQILVSPPPDADEIIRVSESSSFRNLGGEDHPRGRTPDVDGESRPLPGPPPRSTRGRTPRWKFWGLLAASVAALALGIRSTGFLGPDPLAEYLAPADSPTTVTLLDGSFVRLAAGSRLRVWGWEGRREVSLQGRAFFAVSREESRPFVVRTRPGEVEVLGTRFEVAEEENGIRTIVVEGHVRVSNERGTVDVPAGSLARMTRSEAPVLEVSDDVWALLDWADGILVFQDTPLRQVAREVSRHFGRPLAVSDEDLGNRRITAWFQWEPFAEVAEALCLVVDATCAQEGEGVSIGPKDDSGGTR